MGPFHTGHTGRIEQLTNHENLKRNTMRNSNDFRSFERIIYKLISSIDKLSKQIDAASKILNTAFHDIHKENQSKTEEK